MQDKNATFKFALFEYMKLNFLWGPGMGLDAENAAQQGHDKHPWDGNLWVVVIVKSCVNKQAGSWLAVQKSEKPIRSQVSKLTQLMTSTTTHKFPLLSTPSWWESTAALAKWEIWSKSVQVSSSDT